MYGPKLDAYPSAAICDYSFRAATRVVGFERFPSGLFHVGAGRMATKIGASRVTYGARLFNIYREHVGEVSFEPLAEDVDGVETGWQINDKRRCKERSQRNVLQGRPFGRLENNCGDSQGQLLSLNLNV